MESRVVCPAVTRLPGPCSPMPGLAPAEVPTVVSGGRGAGAWPDHSYCSWRGGLRGPGWEAALDTVVRRTRGGERGGESCGVEGQAHGNRSPDPSQSEEHRSVLSLYDNIPDAVSPDSLREVLHMEPSFQEASQAQMDHTWPPEQIRTPLDDEGLTDDKSTWSSCEIILTECGSSKQYVDENNEHEQEPELDSESYGFKQGDLMPPPQPHLAANSPQLSQTEWPLAAVPEQSSWSPRVPPPVPLADPSASALRSLLTSLQQQIVKQREEYEARIVR